MRVCPPACPALKLRLLRNAPRGHPECLRYASPALHPTAPRSCQSPPHRRHSGHPGGALRSSSSSSSPSTMPGSAEIQTAPPFDNIFSLAAACASPSSLQGPDAAAFRRIFSVTLGTACCSVGPELSLKYAMQPDNQQHVVSITNRLTLDQAWFNEARTRKPQTFTPSPAAATAAAHDPTNNGQTCDFCRWDSLTAQDSFGRIERPHAVSGSNLFKYAEPCHGLVLFKHHDPLSFSPDQLADFLAVSEGWFAASHRAHPDARYAFFIWNCLARAGASQFHGHGQLMLTRVPVPTQVMWEAAAERHAQLHPPPHGAQGQRSNGPTRHAGDGGAALALDILRAHRAAGLLRCCHSRPCSSSSGGSRWACDTPISPGAGPEPQDRAWLAASLAPIKDMEVIIMGASLTSPAFVRALHTALRTLIEDLGCNSFNVGIYNIDPTQCQGAEQQDADRHQAATGGQAEAGSIYSAGCWAWDGPLLGLADGPASLEDVPGPGPGPGPVVARVVSRGRMGQQASDFGCLEVVGGASIGHKDPFQVIAAVEARMSKAQ